LQLDFEKQEITLTLNSTAYLFLSNIMASFSEVNQLINSTYSIFWNDWYKNFPGFQPAALKINLGDFTSGYSHSLNSIFIYVCEGNLEDSNILDGSDWPIWLRELVHEMLHEYQNKVPFQPNAEGIQLHSKHRFIGNGHDERFYTSIVIHAPYFKVPVSTFLNML
jgi:hypothetical protein